MLYTNVILSQTVLLCVCLSGRSSGFGVGARTRPDRELLSNMEWSLKPLLWLRVNHLYLNPLTCCCISRWYLTATLSITLITDRKCVVFFFLHLLSLWTLLLLILFILPLLWCCSYLYLRLKSPLAQRIFSVISVCICQLGTTFFVHKCYFVTITTLHSLQESLSQYVAANINEG